MDTSISRGLLLTGLILIPGGALTVFASFFISLANFVRYLHTKKLSHSEPQKISEELVKKCRKETIVWIIILIATLLILYIFIESTDIVSTIFKLMDEKIQSDPF